MAYIGNQQTQGFSQVPAKRDLTCATGTSLTLSHAVASAEGIDLFINNVRQEPTTAYSVGSDGVTITLTGSVVATDDIYVVYNSLALQTTVPPDASVSTAKIIDGNVTAAKLAASLDLSGKALTMPTGAVLQVKAASDTSIRTTVSQTFDIASNTAQVTITPSSATSKFLITCCGVFSCDDGNDAWYATIYRDSTNLGQQYTGLSGGNSVAGVQINYYPCSMTILDSPSTASDITYGLRFRSYNHDGDAATTARLGQELSGTGAPVPTHITVMEIAG